MVRGSVQVNGSTTITNFGAVDSGTGQVTADFDNIPDLGFTNMTLTFASGNRAMLINPSGLRGADLQFDDHAELRRIDRNPDRQLHDDDDCAARPSPRPSPLRSQPVSPTPTRT